MLILDKIVIHFVPFMSFDVFTVVIGCPFHILNHLLKMLLICNLFHRIFFIMPKLLTLHSELHLKFFLFSSFNFLQHFLLINQIFVFELKSLLFIFLSLYSVFSGQPFLIKINFVGRLVYICLWHLLLHKIIVIIVRLYILYKSPFFAFEPHNNPNWYGNNY